MKNIYILAACLLALLAAACNKDDSTAAGPVVTLKATGFKDTFNLNTYRDFLTVTPAVENEHSFDFYWTLFSTSNQANQGFVKPDTLARTKDLNYEIKKDPGTYLLIFNAKEKNTGTVRQVNMIVNITTLTMSGWYMLKSNGGKTDMDFFHSVGRIDNWIAYFNNGKSLDGDYVGGVFSPFFRPTVTSQTNFPVFVMASKNDVGIYRIDNGVQVMNFENMFFSKPAVRKPQAVFQPVSTNQIGLINDGKAYNMIKGTLFSNLPLTYNGINYTNTAPVTASVAQDLCFDLTRKSIFCYSGSYYTELRASNGGNKLQNVNGNLQWAAGFTGSRSVGLLLFRNPQDSGYLYKINGQYGPVATGSGALIMNADTLSPQHGLMRASILGGNYDNDFIYYVVGDKVYKMDIATATEFEQFQLPAGETVTALQHVKYPAPPSSGINYIAIATYNAGRYKVYLHTISGTGDLSALAQPNFEGEGRVSSVIYMDKGDGSRIY